MTGNSVPRNLGARVVAAVLSVILAGWLASAQAADPPKHIRGAVTAVADGKATVKTAAGKEVVLGVGDKTLLFTVTATDINAIQPNKFVGVTSVEQDGKRVAREVHVFAESLRGLGEGHYPWDLDATPNSMTNANIGKVETVGDDHVLKLDYKDGTQTIAIPPTANIVMFDVAPKGSLKTGDKVFAMANAAPDGALDAILFVIGANGQKPPM